MPTWETAGDWDAAQSETGVHHEQPANTAWSPADEVEKGYPPTDPQGATQLYYPADETSGTTANDVAGTSDGTINGATLNANGVFGTPCYSFDGVDDEVDSGYSSVGATQDLTVWSWCNLDGNQDSDHATLAKTEGSEFAIRFESGQARFRLLNWTDVSFYDINLRPGDTTAARTTNWVFFGGAFDHTNGEMRGYCRIAGTAKDAEVFKTKSFSGSWTATADNIHVGNTSGGGNEFVGRIDEPHYVERALTESEFDELYQAPL